MYSKNYSLTAGKRGAPSLTGAMRHLTRPLTGTLFKSVAIRSWLRCWRRVVV